MPPSGTLDFVTVDRCEDVAGIRRRILFNYSGPASYVTGGDPLAASDIRLGVIEDIPEQIATNGTNITCFVYVNSTSKLQAFVPNTGVEVASGVNLSAYTMRVEAIGR
jgi:hypothetical protein